MTGTPSAEWEAWVLNPPSAPRAIRLPGQTRNAPPVGQGFEVKVECLWQNPDTSETVTWRERRLVLQSEAHAQRQQAGVRDRLTKAEPALRTLKPASTQTDLEKRAQALLTHYDVTDYLEVRYAEHIERQTRYLGGGRPGPNRPTQTVETHIWTVKTKRRRAALNRFNRLAGWRVYVTNTPAPRLSLAGAVNCYRQEWQPEHGFHRLKGGGLAITPLFLKDDNRIRGLVLLLGIALWALTLTEFVVRRGRGCRDHGR